MKRFITLIAAFTFLFALPIGCKDSKNKGKPKIEPHCTMNGYGSGKCSFTNKGKGPGASCVKIHLFVVKDSSKTLHSSTICSGKVAVRETKSKEFSLPGVNDLCAGYGVPWTKACAFTVVNDDQLVYYLLLHWMSQMSRRILYQRIEEHDGAGPQLRTSNNHLVLSQHDTPRVEAARLFVGKSGGVAI